MFLKGHAGDNLRVDRVNRPSEHIHAPAITLGLTVQPDVIEHLSSKPGFRGRGLLARILFSLPESKVGSRCSDPAPIPESVDIAYRARIMVLADLGFTGPEPGYPARHELFFSTDAWSRLKQFMDTLEPRLGEGSDLSLIADWGTKLAGAVARISGLLHVGSNWTAEVQPKEIDGETVTRAIEIGEYLISHALAAFDEMDADPQRTWIHRVIGWLHREGITHFSERDLYRRFRQLTKPSLREALMAELIERSIIRREDQPSDGPGRKPSPFYMVNPNLLRRQT